MAFGFEDMQDPDIQQVKSAGEAFVVAELNRRGAYAVSFAGNMPAIDILASNKGRSRTIQIQVKTKRKGDWQTKVSEGRPASENRHESSYWILVDVGPQNPKYYVCPLWWIRNDIYENHQAYLQKHGGMRARNPESLHHSIAVGRVAKWEDRWDVLGLF